MRFVCLFCCAWLLAAAACESGGTSTPTEAKVRVQAGQVTFAGDLLLDESLNDLFKKRESFKSRRTALRQPLWRLYELLKGPEIVRARTAAVAALPIALSNEGGAPSTALAEMIRLAGISAISIAAPEMASSAGPAVESTEKALAAVGIRVIGVLGGQPGGALAEDRVDLGGSTVSLFGVALTDGAIENRRVAAFGRDRKDELVAAVKAAAARARGRGDLAFAVVGWPEKEPFADRRALARRLVDEAGVDAVLGHHRGEYEGMERHGKGIILHNPGPVLRCDLGKDAHPPAFVHRVHLDGPAVSWIEAQPIELQQRASKIGMGTEATNSVVNELVKRSAELDTAVVNEAGRGILDLADAGP